MKKKILVMCILGLLLLANVTTIFVVAKKIHDDSKTKEICKIEFDKNTIDGDIVPLDVDLTKYLKNNLTLEFEHNDPNVDNLGVLTTNLANHKITLDAPWEYDNVEHKDKWGISDSWQEDIEKTSEFHKTTCHACAGPGVGYSSIAASLIHCGKFNPPKDADYSFNFHMYMTGEIKLESMHGVIGSSAARGGASFYFYLWDEEKTYFEKLMTFEDHYSIAGLGNGKYAYSNDYVYRNSAHLLKEESYTFGANGEPWLVCDGFIDSTSFADTWVNWSGLKKLEIEWPNSPPNYPELSSPNNGSVGASTSIDLKWTCSDPDAQYDTLKYDVYFGTSPSPPKVTNSPQSSTSYNPGTLDHKTTYYWKITAIDSKGGTKDSSVWKFTTKEEKSHSLKKTHFANDRLVYEGYRPDFIQEWLVKLLGEKFPNLLKTS